jgi:hypothetical protein
LRTCREDGVSSRLTTFETGGSILIRTVWIAAFCLAGLGGMFATRVTASISEEAVSGPTTVGTSPVQDTLSKADKLNVGYLRYPAERVPVEKTPAVPTAPIAAEIQPAKPPSTAKAGSSPAPDPAARRTTVVLPKPRPRIRPVKHVKDVGLARATVDPNTCHQQDGLGGLLISLSGAPRCEL